MKFNDSQSRAVLHFKGPCMVLAGPGSGKTTVIVNRIRYLTEERLVPPEKILVITFTRTAALEMKERYRILCGGEQGVSFGTFHALFFKILKYAYRYDASNILTEDERYRFLRDAAKSAGLGEEPENEYITALSNEISCVKNSGGELKGYRPGSTDKDTFVKIIAEFERVLRAEGKIDFDDMLLLTHRLFEKSPEILEYWRDAYDFILIDEFQDICPLQYELITQMASPKNNIFIVGDDDQSIYSFRGAVPEMMRQFEKEYKKKDGYETITLGVNYRCSSEIVEYSSGLISKNKKRFKKELRAAKDSIFRDSFLRNSTVRLRVFPDIKKEIVYVANMIEDLNAKGIDYMEMAVLFRTNAEPGSLANLLKHKNIPFTLRDNVPNIYEHWIAKNIFAYMELAEMENRQASDSIGEREKAGNDLFGKEPKKQDADGKEWRRLFLSIANRPSRYISRETMRSETLDFSVIRRVNAGKAYVIERLDKLKYDLRMISKLDPKAAVKYIRKAVGYDDFLKKYASQRSLDADSLFGILDEIEASSAEYNTYAEWKRHVTEYTELLRQKSKERNKEKESGVSLLTFHSAKGTEYDTVFIMDASEDYTPYWQAGKADEIEEERRMFYVAMTRAKNRLFVLHAEDRFGRKYEISRFVKEAGIQKTER